MKAKSLSRAEVSRRIQELNVDTWKNLSGLIDDCSVYAWATGSHHRIDRVSVCALAKFSSNLTTAYRVAKKIKAATGLTVHFYGGWKTGGCLN